MNFYSNESTLQNGTYQFFQEIMLFSLAYLSPPFFFCFPLAFDPAHYFSLSLLFSLFSSSFFLLVGVDCTTWVPLKLHCATEIDVKSWKMKNDV